VKELVYTDLITCFVTCNEHNKYRLKMYLKLLIKYRDTPVHFHKFV